jgi:hypothetical protein
LRFGAKAPLPKAGMFYASSALIYSALSHYFIPVFIFVYLHFPRLLYYYPAILSFVLPWLPVPGFRGSIIYAFTARITRGTA